MKVRDGFGKTRVKLTVRVPAGQAETARHGQKSLELYSGRVQRDLKWVEFAELSGLFFLNNMAMGCWMVPMGNLLASHGLASLVPFAFATSACAAFVSPLVFGAMADRHVAPVRVMRWLAIAASAAAALGATAIHFNCGFWTVLAAIQLYALCQAPTSSIGTSIVLGRLNDPQRQFGPVRSLGTVGWMVGCWLISGLGADSSPVALYAASATWAVVALFTRWLPSPEPPKSAEGLTLRQRLGLDALSLLKVGDHRVVFLAAALFSIPLAAFYPYTPSHLRDLGLQHTAAWMTLGQITEIIAMLILSRVLARWRLKWALAAGLGCGLLRYAFYCFDNTPWVLAGLTLHGFTYTFFFITGQIYLDQRVPGEWRVRAQALYSLMTSGVGNLLGYLGTGMWFRFCHAPGTGRADWILFWGGLDAAVAAVAIFFLLAYHGRPHAPAQRGNTASAA